MSECKPLCGVYDTEYCLDEIDFFLTNESSNAVKDFLINVPVCFVQQKNLADDENLLLNVNTRNDFDKTINL
jgi:molybdopterin-guanine dinucleotide biosynthesis protein A